MAYDKVVDSGVLDAGLTSIADAIRTRGETTASLSFPEGMAAAVTAIPKNFKRFEFASSAAVANQDITVVAGDPDVAAHWSDESASCVVRKVTNITTQGLFLLYGCNKKLANGQYGVYANLNSTNTANGLPHRSPLNTAETASDAWAPLVKCDASGNIKVSCLRLQNNFGGAEYVIEFMW